MIIWPPNIDLTGKFVVKEVKHHNFAVCLCELPYRYVAKTKIIDIFIDDERLRKYTSVIEKIPINFYRSDKRIFAIIVLFPLSEVDYMLEDKIVMSTTQWYRWSLEITPPSSYVSELMDYIRAFSTHFKPRYKPELIVKGLNNLLLPRIAILNTGTPIFTDYYEINKLGKKLKTIDIQDILLILPLNPIGIVKSEYEHINPLEIYIQLTKPKAYYKLLTKDTYSNISEYYRVISRNLDIQSFKNVIVPFYNLIKGKLEIIHLTEGRIKYHEFLNDKCILNKGFYIRFNRSPLSLIYRLGNFTIKQNIYLYGNMKPECLRSTSISYRGYLIYDSGSKNELILCQELVKKVAK